MPHSVVTLRGIRQAPPARHGQLRAGL